ncbi:hypothetical protein NPIL_666211 [Nephila pilipes]|uniref:Uncharacterized protein n=1 Tax=Nephila pilipes TaxID=299642 RepID=A0A8X6NAB0_NEPPI|nr:hypothetical protein NPIL_666211 [Nephila pilipes]
MIPSTNKLQKDPTRIEYIFVRHERANDFDECERSSFLMTQFLLNPPRTRLQTRGDVLGGVTYECHNHNHHRRTRRNMKNKQTNTWPPFLRFVFLPSLNRIGGFMTLAGGPLAVTAGFDLRPLLASLSHPPSDRLPVRMEHVLSGVEARND